jgi:hypothetical protein
MLPALDRGHQRKTIALLRLMGVDTALIHRFTSG